MYKFKFFLFTGIFLVQQALALFSLKSEPQGLNYTVKPWYKYRTDGKAGREVMIFFSCKKLFGKITVKIETEGKAEQFNIQLQQAQDSLSVLLPENVGLKSTMVNLTISSASGKFVQEINVPAKKKWTVYIYPHSHVDIGYTNLQEVVKDLHIRNIDVGIDIASKTRDYPDGAKFVWNPEATWVVERYLNKATAGQKQSFVNAVRKGWIQIDAAHSNINTSTCSDEQLLAMFKSSAQIESFTGIPITTMVQMDNPGASWGLVQAAAKNGVKAFFSFPNYYDLRQAWENKPFYWLSNNGKDKLFYLQATSYGYGFRAKGQKYGLGKIQAFTTEYDRLSTDNPLENFIDPFIFQETQKLEDRNSPYEIFVMTWSMADNCLIDADLPDAVKLWNAQYAYPKLVIAGSKTILEAYESKYKSIIPEYRGDMTEFWTQGLASDAKRVGIGRIAKEDVVQAEVLWSMLGKKNNPGFDRVWDNLLLSAEHTWGYQDPTAPLAHQVEQQKAAYFEQAGQLSKALIEQGVKDIKKDGENGFAVINTLSWARKGLIKITLEESKKGDKVVNEQGREMNSQRLSTGELAFLSDSIPPFGSAFYQIKPGKQSKKPAMSIGKDHLNNSLLAVSVDTLNGNITSIIDLKTKREFVDRKSPFGFNSYNHLYGVKNGKPEMMPGKPTSDKLSYIEIKEKGPLLSTLVIHSKGRGSNWIRKEITLIKDQAYIVLNNTLDKTATTNKEGIHYGFPFQVPSGKIKMDIPLGFMQPETDQIPFSNKNWFAFQRWIDISNADYGVSWTAIEAPIVELGNLSGDILDGARQAREWIKQVPETQTLFSWSINNHWDTNFPLKQSGIISNKYVIMPHEGNFEPSRSEQFGTAQNRPLIVVPAAQNPIKKSMLLLSNPKIVVSTLQPLTDEQGVLLRLKSVSEQAEEVELTWPNNKQAVLYKSTPYGTTTEQMTGKIKLIPHELMTLKVLFK